MMVIVYTTSDGNLRQLLHHSSILACLGSGGKLGAHVIVLEKRSGGTVMAIVVNILLKKNYNNSCNVTAQVFFYKHTYCTFLQPAKTLSSLQLV